VLLRKGGLLIANELTAKTDFLTLTFGLTDGWWLFDDAKWRIPGAPLLSRYALPTVSKCFTVTGPTTLCDLSSGCLQQQWSQLKAATV
jgi:hypothetical protein